MPYRSYTFFLLIIFMNIHTTLHTQDLIPLQRGYLFSFEGIDGSGKTTIMKLVAEGLQKKYFSVVTTREPGATQLGQHLRSLLMNQTVPTCTLAEFLLFAADRAEHFHEFVIPKLQECCIVLSDRMADSSMVYQGYVKGLDQSMIESVNTWAMQYRKPDIVFYLRINAQTALDRINSRNETAVPFEQEIVQKKEKIIEGFDTLFKNKKNTVILDSTMSKSLQSNTIVINQNLSAQDIADIIIAWIVPYIQSIEES